MPGCKGRGSGAGRLAGLLTVPRAHLFQELLAGLSRFILLLVMELRTAHISSGGGPGLSCGPAVQSPCDNQRQLEPGDAGDSLKRSSPHHRPHWTDGETEAYGGRDSPKSTQQVTKTGFRPEVGSMPRALAGVRSCCPPPLRYLPHAGAVFFI